jgi:hypothetical protein
MRFARDDARSDRLPAPAKPPPPSPEQGAEMTKRSRLDASTTPSDDPAVYSGRAGRGPSPFAIFLIATFWLGVIGSTTMFFSILWGSIILGIAAITLICALLNAG